MAANKRYKKPESLKVLERMHIEMYALKYPNVPRYAIPAKKYDERTANGLTTCVVKLIEFMGGFAERINTTGLNVIDKNGKSRIVKGSSTNGSADVHATINNMSLKLEVKCKFTNDNIQSDAQKEYQKKVEAVGNIYGIVREFTPFYEWLMKQLNKQPYECTK